MSVTGATDIKTTLNYSVDDGQRQHYVAYQPTAEERAASGVPEEMFKGASNGVETTVWDARGKNFTLDANSFELVEQTTRLSTEDFYNRPEKVTDAYYEEMAELFKKATGATCVHVFHHQVRSASKNNSDGNGFNTSVQPYAHGIHSDSSAHAAQELFRRFAGSAVDKKYCKGRFLYINAWRNIADMPIENNSLAVCDETSLVKPDDYLGSDLYMPGGQRLMQYRLNERNAAKHRWYYYSKMKKEEVLLFKQWDSDTTLPGRLTFHTAFSDPNAPPDAPERESIECRGIAFFPDHEPNTCPELPDEAKVEGTEDVSDDDEQVKAAVTKMLGLIDTIPSWPLFAKTWLKSTAVKKNGAYEVAKTIVEDAQNYQGFQKYSPGKKAKIVELLMKNNWEAKLRAKIVQLGSVETLDRSATLKSLAWVAVGCVVGYMSAQMRR
jgi:hypothetical protein